MTPNSKEKNLDEDNITIESQKSLKESKTKLNKEDLETGLKGNKKKGSKKYRLKIKCKNDKENKNYDKYNHLSKKRRRGLSKHLFFEFIKN